jgi:hypothetical protein
MGEIFATLQGCLAALDGFNESRLLGEIAADRLLCKHIGGAAPLGGQFCQLVLLLWV